MTQIKIRDPLEMSFSSLMEEVKLRVLIYKSYMGYLEEQEHKWNELNHCYGGIYFHLKKLGLGLNPPTMENRILSYYMQNNWPHLSLVGVQEVEFAHSLGMFEGYEGPLTREQVVLFSRVCCKTLFGRWGVWASGVRHVLDLDWVMGDRERRDTETDREQIISHLMNQEGELDPKWELGEILAVVYDLRHGG